LPIASTSVRTSPRETPRTAASGQRSPKRPWVAAEPNGGTLFDHACRLGFERIVSKRRDAPYRSGRSGTWLKVKNREHPAMSRDWEDRFS